MCVVVVKIACEHVNNVKTWISSKAVFWIIQTMYRYLRWVCVTSLVSWKGCEEGQLSCLHPLLPLWSEEEVFGLRATAEEQDVGLKTETWERTVKLSQVKDKDKKVTVSPFFPWAILSWKADLKGATPVPGPTIITGMSFSTGNFRVPFFTQRGTYTSPETWHKITFESVPNNTNYFQICCENDNYR